MKGGIFFLSLSYNFCWKFFLVAKIERQDTWLLYICRFGHYDRYGNYALTFSSIYACKEREREKKREPVTVKTSQKPSLRPTTRHVKRYLLAAAHPRGINYYYCAVKSVQSLLPRWILIWELMRLWNNYINVKFSL